jgi:hypothetical protein
LRDARGMQDRCVPFRGLRKVLGEIQPVTRLARPLMELRGFPEYHYLGG